MAINFPSKQISTQCCIAGGGPAGMMAGLLMARAGVDVLVLEKHADFLRDFRGDTIHPSTLELMQELGLLDSFLRRKHQELREVTAQIGPFHVTLGDFSHLPTTCKFVALMPQWDFLNFLAEAGGQFRGFNVRMESEAVDLIENGGRVRGIRAKTREGMLDVRADLVIGADGRHSVIRQKAGFGAKNLGAPMDVLWMSIRRKDTDPTSALGRVDSGKFFVMLYRDDYWQCGFVIPKGGFEEIRARGLESFQKLVVEIAPFFSDRIEELDDWNKVKLLSVAVDRLQRWYRSGLLCIGDSAHAMSPIGGVGINLAIQDAVAAANILAPAFERGEVSTDLLRKVQERRMFPTRAMQAVQVFVQNRVVSRTLRSAKPIRTVPLPFKLLNTWPRLRRITGRIVGMGFRPEHIHTTILNHGGTRAVAHT